MRFSRKIARLREQRAEEEKVGLPEIERQIDAVSDQIAALEDDLDIRADGDSDEQIVLGLVVRLSWSADTKTPLAKQYGKVWLTIDLLGKMAKRTTGFLRIVAEDISEPGDRLIDQMIIGGGKAPVKTTASLEVVR